ncbi:MAG: hypothetical protein CMN30_27590 [Sandaracinus sp.]|nr:hypothetical protein [Sandaracinus sp.]|tara:strand:+ start:637 stop:2010 length:1374 start_codon:yes stop_codon:yes gene_type:complete
MAKKKQKRPGTGIGRRNVLRGIAGGAAVTLGLPLFDYLFDDNGTAMADGGPIPRRFGVYFWGNGVIPERWIPSGTGEGYELSEQLASLAPVRDRLSVVTGMNIETGNERGHHAGTVGILSGSPMISQEPTGGAGYASTFSAPSIDQVVAQAIGSETFFPSIEYGVHDGAPGSEGTTLKYLSHNGPDNVNPPEYDPRALFARLFGEGFVAPDETPEVDPRLALRRSVLDAVLQDGADLRARLGHSDQIRLEQHMDGIRALEMRLQRLEMETPAPYLDACTRPGEPTDPGGDLRERSRLLADIMAMGLACDRTRVFSNMFSGSVSNTRYPGTSAGHHSQTHDEGDPWTDVHAATMYIMQCFSDMLVAFQDIPEGGETMLDHMVVLGSTDLSWDHSPNDYPILVAGGACGYLRTPGVHYRSSGENASKVLLSTIRAAGVDMAEFGNGGGHVTESCTEIES